MPFKRPGPVKVGRVGRKTVPSNRRIRGCLPQTRQRGCGALVITYDPPPEMRCIPYKVDGRQTNAVVSCAVQYGPVLDFSFHLHSSSANSCKNHHLHVARLTYSCYLLSHFLRFFFSRVASRLKSCPYPCQEHPLPISFPGRRRSPHDEDTSFLGDSSNAVRFLGVRC